MIKAVIVGYGNIGKYVLDAVKSAEDFVLAGVVRRDARGPVPPELAGVEIVDDVAKLSQKPDVAILSVPSRMVSTFAKDYLEKGIHTVDSFDIHTEIWDLKNSLDPIARKNGVTSVISAGWDPGSDSMVRALLEVCAPKGVTYTNFGPGMSMGHTVAVKAVEGVKKALSMTIPTGTGIHRRMVYVEVQEGYSFEKIAETVKNDPYFVHDETHVLQVESVDALLDMGHGVNLTRKGVSGITQNQLFEFDMRINNPALTAQILVGAARAAVSHTEGCYTMIELPLISMLPGDLETLVKRLV